MPEGLVWEPVGLLFANVQSVVPCRVLRNGESCAARSPSHYSEHGVRFERKRRYDLRWGDLQRSDAIAFGAA